MLTPPLSLSLSGSLLFPRPQPKPGALSTNNSSSSSSSRRSERSVTVDKGAGHKQDCEAKQRGYGGSGLFNKQERSSGSGSAYQEDWRGLKMARTEDLGSSKSMLMVQQQPSLVRSNSGYSEGQMLSFSNPKSDSIMISSNEATLPYYHHALSAYNRSSGLGSGGLNTSMHGALTGARGPFTPSQWMELEHQALIYKYINANVPIPSNLLLPIRKVLNPSGFSSFAGPFRPNTLGWGSFHPGFSGNNDPEPGRCRRTDGKKWRCSRDAVADQKYCERHMNRGRHRSRKPVEGQTGHAAAGPATAKVMPMASSTPASLVPGGSASNSLNVRQHQLKNYQPGVSNPSANSDLNRISLNNENVGGKLHDSRGTSMVSPTMNLKPKDTTFSNLKQHFQCEDSSRMDFGLVSSESLVNSSQKSSYLNCRNYGISSDLNDRESKTQDPLRHFMDDWPKNSSNSSSWPEMEESQLDRTQLSISIPMSSDFSSSTSSPNHEKLALSPLRLSRECNPVQMGLGVGSVLNEPTQRQANWIPISWESSVGGPLGEVLNNTSNTSGGECKNSSSALNLMTEGWDVSPHMELSPTGVLQKTAFGSLSNSSTVSSPRAETNLTNEGASLCDNLLGPTLVNSSSIPSLLGAG